MPDNRNRTSAERKRNPIAGQRNNKDAFIEDVRSAGSERKKRGYSDKRNIAAKSTVVRKYSGDRETGSDKHNTDRRSRIAVKNDTARVIDLEKDRDILNSRMSTRTVDYVPVDATFLTVVIILLIFGLVMVFSASYAQSIKDNGSASEYFLSQLKFAGIGLVMMLGITYFFDYYMLKKWANLILFVGIMLLVVVLIFGDTRGGSKRWLDIGITSFQPSELTKVAVIIYIARWCEDHRSSINKARSVLWPITISVVPTALLLLMQPHFSALILIILTALIMLVAGGMNKKITILAAIAGIGLVYLFIAYGNKIPVEYIQDRWHAWKDYELYALGTGYQTNQSVMAISSGGFFGVGLGNSRQKQLFLPESHNDYILSIIAEELGFIGVIVVVILFSLLIWKGVTIALKARDRFGFMLVTGILIIISLQFILNIAVVTNAIPVTGISLPFFSYGGTALVILLCEMGLILNVSRQRQTDDE